MSFESHSDRNLSRRNGNRWARSRRVSSSAGSSESAQPGEPRLLVRGRRAGRCWSPGAVPAIYFAAWDGLPGVPCILYSGSQSTVLVERYLNRATDHRSPRAADIASPTPMRTHSRRLAGESACCHTGRRPATPGRGTGIQPNPVARNARSSSKFLLFSIFRIDKDYIALHTDLQLQKLMGYVNVGLYRPRPIWARLDITPFIVLQTINMLVILGHCFTSTNEATVLPKDLPPWWFPCHPPLICMVAVPILFGAQVLVHLGTYWSVHFRTIATMFAVKDITAARFVKVLPRKSTEQAGICTLERINLFDDRGFLSEVLFTRPLHTPRFLLHLERVSHSYFPCVCCLLVLPRLFSA